jgi:hypothetical protein
MDSQAKHVTVAADADDLLMRFHQTLNSTIRYGIRRLDHR